MNLQIIDPIWFQSIYDDRDLFEVVTIDSFARMAVKLDAINRSLLLYTRSIKVPSVNHIAIFDRLLLNFVKLTKLITNLT